VPGKMMILAGPRLRSTLPAVCLDGNVRMFAMLLSQIRVERGTLPQTPHSLKFPSQN
jgi:hypothetical protein